MIRRVLDWLDARSGYRAGVSHVLDEPVPPGTGWWFTLGSALLALLTMQLITGAFLVLYYAPTPDHAYASVRFITEQVTYGRFVRGLHYFGASALIICAIAHLLRVVGYGSYKAPRELTWLVGLALFLIILAFGLTGYLLPWDQRAYWATVVTINVAKLTPIVGDLIATALRGGSEIGALTLTRWFALHVVFLPAILVTLVVLHLFLMRRHGISGPVRLPPLPARPFYPYHAIRDMATVLLLSAVLGGLVWHGMPAPTPLADPADSSYVPRPEWYFLGLFQLLKYFPGRLEIVGALILPSLAVAALALLPWMDRRRDRAMRRRGHVLSFVAMGFLGAVALTVLGWRDTPAQAERATRWAPAELAGSLWIRDAGCHRCHVDDGPVDTLETQPITHGRDWTERHIAGPEAILPGPVRPARARLAHAVASYVMRLQRGPLPAPATGEERAAAQVFASRCIACHSIDGDGARRGPDLSRVGERRDASWLARWIANPKAILPRTEMPAFGGEISDSDMRALVSYLAARR